MNGHEILAIGAQRLSAALSAYSLPPFEPTAISPWVGMALLQKAVRRGRLDLALRAAATLLQVSPDRLWRRLGCIAFEDVGLGDLPTVSIATAALAGKRVRARLGGEWAVASCVVRELAQATKCRAADDLLMCAELHPAYKSARHEFATLPTRELFDIVASERPLPERAIALWYAIGTDRRPSVHLRQRRGEPNAVFDLLCERGYPDTLVEIAREGFRNVHEVLCPFVALLFPEFHPDTAAVQDDDLPSESLIRGIPGWAYDLYSKEGRAALQLFLQGTSETARWVRAHISPSKRVSFVGGIVFRVEGGLVRQRMRWPFVDELRRLVDIECHGPLCPDATEILALMRNDLPLLNRVRCDAL